MNNWFLGPSFPWYKLIMEAIRCHSDSFRLVKRKGNLWENLRSFVLRGISRRRNLVDLTWEHVRCSPCYTPQNKHGTQNPTPSKSNELHDFGLPAVSFPVHKNTLPLGHQTFCFDHKKHLPPRLPPGPFFNLRRARFLGLESATSIQAGWVKGPQAQWNHHHKSPAIINHHQSPPKKP